MVSQIYDNLGQEHIFGISEKTNEKGDYQINYDKTLLKGVLRVVTASVKHWPEISRVTDDLTEFAGAEVVVLDLPVNQPDSILLAEEAGKNGFVFSGIRPQEAPDGDYFRMQRLHVPMDLTKLTIYSDLGLKLLNYVEKSSLNVK